MVSQADFAMQKVRMHYAAKGKNKIFNLPNEKMVILWNTQ
jgi:hypothetical protein